MSDVPNNPTGPANQPNQPNVPSRPEQRGSPAMPWTVPGMSLPAPAKGPETWLVAAWPGMGNVAVLAAGYLVNSLGLKPVGEMVVRTAGIGPNSKAGPQLNISDVFDVEHVQVKDGVIIPPRLPRSLLFQSEKPINGRNLVVFIGEAQPNTGNYAFAHALLDKAQQLGASKVLTFASMSAQIHAAETPRVFGVTTSAGMLEQLKMAEVQPLEDGQITGLNGVLLGAAAERNMQGVCLLGEIPMFAAAIANPRAAKGVLDSFSVMSSIELDLKPLDTHIAKVDRLLIKLEDRLTQQSEGGEHGHMPINLNELIEEVEEETADTIPDAEAVSPAPETLDQAHRDKIEALFQEVRKNRARSGELKAELDRLGVFEQYENRFLDLFKKTE